MRQHGVSAVTQHSILRRYGIVSWANALSLRILLQHNTQHYVVKWLYYDRMRYHSVSAVTQDATLHLYGIIFWANSLSLRILLQHRTRHYVITGLYHDRMRYDCVSAVTHDWTLRCNAIVSWANASSVRTCCNGRSYKCISGTLRCLIGYSQGGYHESGRNRCLFLLGWPRVGLLKTHRHKNNVNTMSEWMRYHSVSAVIKDST
jgi:hypothetical protein